MEDAGRGLHTAEDESAYISKIGKIDLYLKNMILQFPAGFVGVGHICITLWNDMAEFGRK